MPNRVSGPTAARTAALSVLAVIAFAANSVLCRLALGQQLIDAASFTTIRVVSGAVVLALIMLPRWRIRERRPADWRMVAMLCVYMVFFSFAYLSLSVGTGALVLFGSVQLAMFVAGIRGGEYFAPLSWAGLALALLGLVYLVWPGVTAPDPIGAALMTVAGLGWAYYSLLGRGVADPVESTANNFIFSVPIVLLVSLLFAGDFYSTRAGVFWAVISGAVASGLGYVMWYAALKGLTATRAATVQLSVPVIPALAGVVLLSEPITLRLVLASIATLGGVALVLAQKARPAD